VEGSGSERRSTRVTENHQWFAMNETKIEIKRALVIEEKQEKKRTRDQSSRVLLVMNDRGRAGKS
jgi:hypothetical protein